MARYAAVSSTPAPLTAEDLAAFRFVNEVAISPDGSRVAYAVGKEAVFVRYQEDTHELTRGGKPRNRIDHARRIADWFDAHP